LLLLAALPRGFRLGLALGHHLLQPLHLAELAQQLLLVMGQIEPRQIGLLLLVMHQILDLLTQAVPVLPV
jgi:hypothetical protein